MLAFHGPAVPIGRMKLLLLNGNTNSAMSATLAGLADNALTRLGRKGVEVVPATARFGARYIASRAAAAIAGHAVLDALAERIGRDNLDRYDAAIIACFGDPGLEAAKELCLVPVIGMAEASLAVGLRWAPRVAFLTGGAAWVPMLEEFCLVRGFGRDRVLVRSVTPTGEMIARDPQGALSLLAGAAGEAVAAGAGVVVLGGAGLAGLATQLAPALPVPVLDSLDCAIEEALSAAEAPRASTPGGGGTGLPSLNLAPALARFLKA